MRVRVRVREKEREREREREKEKENMEKMEEEKDKEKMEREKAKDKEKDKEKMEKMEKEKGRHPACILHRRRRPLAHRLALIRSSPTMRSACPSQNGPSRAKGSAAVSHGKNARCSTMRPRAVADGEGAAPTKSAAWSPRPAAARDTRPTTAAKMPGDDDDGIRRRRTLR
jgi:hypothetical protein